MTYTWKRENIAYWQILLGGCRTTCGSDDEKRSVNAMAVNHFPGGEWPTMLTPFRDGAVDYPALEALVEWYIAHGVSGLFAVCQSSECSFCLWRSG